jgi:hypothetical protein
MHADKKTSNFNEVIPIGVYQILSAVAFVISFFTGSELM